MLEELKKERESHSIMSDSLQSHGLYSPWNSPGQNTGVGSRFLLQGLFPTQRSNPGLLHCRWILYHQVKPKGDRKSQRKEMTDQARSHRRWTGASAPSHLLCEPSLHLWLCKARYAKLRTEPIPSISFPVLDVHSHFHSNSKDVFPLNILV